MRTTDDDPPALESLGALRDVQDARGVLTRIDLTASGLSAADIRYLVGHGRLIRVHRDAYRVPTADDDRHADFRAAVVAVRRRQAVRVVTGPAALAVLDLPLFGEPRLVHVTVDERGGSSARSVSATVARPPDDQLRHTPEGPVAGAARAVLDTARLHSLIGGVMAADVALRRGLTSRDELAEVLATMHGLKGVDRARLCLDLASRHSESPGESWSAVVLHQHGIVRPRRQEVFSDVDGTIGRVDFWWPATRTVGEFDGRVKYARANPSGRPSEDVLWDEKRREDRLRRQVSAVVRWTVDDLLAPATFTAHLRRATGS